MSNLVTEVITMPCETCGRRSTLNLPEEPFYSWMYGDSTIEEAFPYFSKEEISLLTTGNHIHE